MECRMKEFNKKSSKQFFTNDCDVVPAVKFHCEIEGLRIFALNLESEIFRARIAPDKALQLANMIYYWYGKKKEESK